MADAPMPELPVVLEPVALPWDEQACPHQPMYVGRMLDDPPNPVKKRYCGKCLEQRQLEGASSVRGVCAKCSVTGLPEMYGEYGKPMPVYCFECMMEKMRLDRAPLLEELRRQQATSTRVSKEWPCVSCMRNLVRMPPGYEGGLGKKDHEYGEPVCGGCAWTYNLRKGKEQEASAKKGKASEEDKPDRSFNGPLRVAH